MAAEVDAQMAAAAAAANGSGAGGRHYAELKTYMIPRHQKAAADMYNVKHPRWWLQSWLAGVPTLVLGGRDQTGCLRKVCGGVVVNDSPCEGLGPCETWRVA
jgi:RAT1-interacting protein